ncbi:hypothetical protein VDGL01_02323 [Verticillium dahliae]
MMEADRKASAVEEAAARALRRESAVGDQQMRWWCGCWTLVSAAACWLVQADCDEPGKPDQASSRAFHIGFEHDARVRAPMQLAFVSRIGEVGLRDASRARPQEQGKAWSTEAAAVFRLNKSLAPFSDWAIIAGPANHDDPRYPPAFHRALLALGESAPAQDGTTPRRRALD